MRIHSLRIRSFRAHEDSALTFAPKINLLHGPNGAGKTNVLEAVHYLCLTKSFLKSKDQQALRKGATCFALHGAFGGRRRRMVDVRLVYQARKGKSIFTNGAPLERKAHLMGMLPVVSFAPGDIGLTQGGPEERRRFLNIILCQERPAYVEDSQLYGRALSQRNKLLLTARRHKTRPDPALMASINRALVRYGGRIISARARFLAAFASYVQQAYEQLGSVQEIPGMKYRGIAEAESSPEEIEARFLDRLERAQESEISLGFTRVGPHRDDVLLAIDGAELRHYASQGQHRTFGIAIKLAQYFYLESRLSEPPILLLDDVFDTLDVRRCGALLELLRGDLLGQSLITSANADTIARVISFADAANLQVRIKAGRVCPAPEDP